MANKPPVFKVPPAPAKKGTGERGTFNAFINAHPALKPYAGAIWTNATNYGGITPTQLAAVLWAESKGNPAATSSAGAKGIGQIWDTKANAVNAAGVPFFRPGNLNISDADKNNPAFAIQYAAWRLSGYATTHGGSIDQIWIGGYNPRYRPGVDGPANFVSQYLPKGYVGTPNSTISQSATKSVQTTAATQAAKAQQFDKWAVLDAKGNVKFISIVDPTKPPKNVLEYGGTPLTQSGFVQTWRNKYADTFFAYTGRSARGAEIKSILASGQSIYTLSNTLADGKDFTKSPAWKAHAPGLVSYARTILGDQWKPSGGIIRKAIAQNWDQATFYAHLRQQPAYQQGPEFKTNLAQNTDAFEQIYGKGVGDAAVAQSIKQKTLDGWTPTEFQSWLRSQPAYTSSPEYQTKSLSLLTQLGLVTGAVPTLSEGQVNGMLNTPRQVAGVPYSSAGSQGRSNGA